MVSGGKDSATTDIVVDVRQTRIPILFFDPRPSWMSTFVRRAIERDPRFVLTSRVVTSRNLQHRRRSAAGSTRRRDCIGSVRRGCRRRTRRARRIRRRRPRCVHAPSRWRCDSTVRSTRTRPVRATTNSGAWAVSTDSAVVPIGTAGADTAALRASEVMWPLRVPTNAHVFARTQVNPKHSAVRRCRGLADVGRRWPTRRQRRPRCVALSRPIGIRRILARVDRRNRGVIAAGRRGATEQCDGASRRADRRARHLRDAALQESNAGALQCKPV